MCSRTTNLLGSSRSASMHEVVRIVTNRGGDPPKRSKRDE